MSSLVRKCQFFSSELKESDTKHKTVRQLFFCAEDSYSSAQNVHITYKINM